jgi:hypothetical protein
MRPLLRKQESQGRFADPRAAVGALSLGDDPDPPLEVPVAHRWVHPLTDGARSLPGQCLETPR